MSTQLVSYRVINILQGAMAFSHFLHRLTSEMPPATAATLVCSLLFAFGMVVTVVAADLDVCQGNLGLKLRVVLFLYTHGRTVMGLKGVSFRLDSSRLILNRLDSSRLESVRVACASNVSFRVESCRFG